MTKPISSGGCIATFFNERLQTDLFLLWQRWYVIWVDQATRYAVSHLLQSKDSHEWLKTFLANWVRYFGAPITLVSDQEGAVISDMLGRACEAFGMERELAGSETHTRTGMAERRIGVVKLASLKLYAQARRQGMKASQDECVYEATMCSNSCLVYDTYTPNQAVLGYEPRDLYSMDNTALSAYKDARSTKPDSIETAIRMRLLAKESIIQSVIEHRIAESANTKVQQYSPEEVAKLTPGSKVDIFREPESKETSSWKGPADLIHTIPREGKAVVQWRGHPYGLPLRHIRPHVGFLWLLEAVGELSAGGASMSDIVAKLMDLIDEHASGQIFTYGKIWSPESQSFYNVPDTLQEQPPPVYRLATQVSGSVLQFAPVSGVQFGTACKTTESMVNISHGKLVVWNRQNRSGYKISSVIPSKRYTLTSRGSYSDYSFFLVYNFGNVETDNKDKEIDIPVEDLDTSGVWSPSTIPWHSLDDDEDSPWIPIIPSPPSMPPMPPGPPVAAQPPVELIPEPVPIEEDDHSMSLPPVPEESIMVDPPTLSPVVPLKLLRDREVPEHDRSRSMNRDAPPEVTPPPSPTVPQTLDFSPRGELRPPLDVSTGTMRPSKKPNIPADSECPASSSNGASSSSQPAAPILPLAGTQEIAGDRIVEEQPSAAVPSNADAEAQPSLSDSTVEYPPTVAEDREDDNEQDSLETLDYGDESSIQASMCEATPPGWMKFCNLASKIPEHNILHLNNDDEFLAHAMADARRVLEAAESDTLPWTSHDALLVIPGPWRESSCFFVDIFTGECFPITESNLLTEAEVAQHFAAVEAADIKEIQSFVSHKVFSVDLAVNSDNTIDAVWVRRWIDKSKGVVKSRCCGRGFLDKQRSKIDRHSSTASMMSHKLACALSVQMDWTVEALDISTAFLQGLRFTDIADKARTLGVEIREMRKIWLRPPANVWRYLRSLGWTTVLDQERHLFLLMLLKAMYGLVDGPLMFQLAFSYFLRMTLHFVPSLHDDNFLMLYSPARVLIMVLIIHVDDLLVFGEQYNINWSRTMIENKFGRVKRQTLPLTWCGIQHEMVSPRHLFLHQDQYLDKLKIVVPSYRVADTELLPDRDFELVRSLIMCFLWICRTRQDAIQDTVELQKDMLSPTGATLKAANGLYKRLVSNRHMNGLHFCYCGPHVRLIQLSDAGHITSKSCYPQEGRMVLLASDGYQLRSETKEFYGAGESEFFGGPTCPLFVSSKKAPRVSYSTSHSETNPCISTTAVTSLLANRFSELDYLPMYGRLPRPKDLLRLMLQGNHTIPADLCTDAMNLWELICHSKTLPGDKHHRVGVLALREERLCRRIRHVCHLPTKIMLADQLTKQMISTIYMRYCSTGFWDTRLSKDNRIRIRRALRRPSTYTESDLERNEFLPSDGSLGDELELEEFLTLLDTWAE